MFAKGQKDGTIRFSLRPSGNAQKVRIAGSFSQWKPLPMRRQRDGGFAVTTTVPSGTHEYKFIVDKQWTADPDNASYALNPYGSANSVIQAA